MEPSQAMELLSFQPQSTPQLQWPRLSIATILKLAKGTSSLYLKTHLEKVLSTVKTELVVLGTFTIKASHTTPRLSTGSGMSSQNLLTNTKVPNVNLTRQTHLLHPTTPTIILKELVFGPFFLSNGAPGMLPPKKTLL